MTPSDEERDQRSSERAERVGQEREHEVLRLEQVNRGGETLGVGGIDTGGGGNHPWAEHHERHVDDRAHREADDDREDVADDFHGAGRAV
ncbi:hypothetical protein K8640_12965 [Myxococcus sp. XM-1-1-1]|nr:hypothetical protein [Myxococcus sp. AS-1-15]MBZ4409132.1 hypothetical protein [Myxococcus sp. XM-1-1-1]